MHISAVTIMKTFVLEAQWTCNILFERYYFSFGFWHSAIFPILRLKTQEGELDIKLTE